jgi:N-acetylglucosamine-6-phosphate deacetylase
MATSVRNARDMLQIDTVEAARMASTYPADFLRIGGEYGRIAAGYRANFVVADSALNVSQVWIDGVPCAD